MGLDMYLHKDIYVGANWEHGNVTGVIDLYKDGNKINVDFKRVSSIRELRGVWRKANAIHNWFVENVQGGEDDCKEHYVNTESLELLRDTCQAVLDDHDLADDLLPTKSGFFFGSEEYDEYYFNHLEYTVQVITEMLEENEFADGYYQASW